MSCGHTKKAFNRNGIGIVGHRCKLKYKFLYRYFIKFPIYVDTLQLGTHSVLSFLVTVEMILLVVQDMDDTVVLLLTSVKSELSNMYIG